MPFHSRGAFACTCARSCACCPDHLGSGERRLPLRDDALVHLRHELVRRLPGFSFSRPYDQVRPQRQEGGRPVDAYAVPQPLQERADVVQGLDPRQVRVGFPGREL